MNKSFLAPVWLAMAGIFVYILLAVCLPQLPNTPYKYIGIMLLSLLSATCVCFAFGKLGVAEPSQGNRNGKAIPAKTQSKVFVLSALKIGVSVVLFAATVYAVGCFLGWKYLSSDEFSWTHAFWVLLQLFLTVTCLCFASSKVELSKFQRAQKDNRVDSRTKGELFGLTLMKMIISVILFDSLVCIVGWFLGWGYFTLDGISGATFLVSILAGIGLYIYGISRGRRI